MINLPNIKITGLTGMSGAGKSTVRDVFHECGFYVIDCDVAARKAVCPAFLNEVRERISPELVINGTLDRKKTAALIFTDENVRRRYNAIIYPYIIYIVLDGIKRAGRDVLLDAPTLFESGLDMVCGKIISVCADKRLCEERITRRDGITPEQARERLASQHGEDFFRARSDYIIDNNGGEEELSEAARRLAERLICGK